MINRKYLPEIENKLKNFAAVGLLGARQIGKTTLAQKIASKRPSIYLDLENYRDLAKLSDPLSYFELHQDKLIILDEIQRKPEIFATLRSAIDQRRRKVGTKKACGQFLILGSASLDLLKQSSESLAGRVSYIEMNPISITEFAKSTPTNCESGCLTANKFVINPVPQPASNTV
jgi:predicted AAA+ superfamily ATPase